MAVTKGDDRLFAATNSDPASRAASAFENAVAGVKALQRGRRSTASELLETRLFPYPRAGARRSDGATRGARSRSAHGATEPSAEATRRSTRRRRCESVRHRRAAAPAGASLTSRPVPASSTPTRSGLSRLARSRTTPLRLWRAPDLVADELARRALVVGGDHELGARPVGRAPRQRTRVTPRSSSRARPRRVAGPPLRIRPRLPRGSLHALAEVALMRPGSAKETATPRTTTRSPARKRSSASAHRSPVSSSTRKAPRNATCRAYGVVLALASSG
jgi:hypothetical protein